MKFVISYEWWSFIFIASKIKFFSQFKRKNKPGNKAFSEKYVAWLNSLWLNRQNHTIPTKYKNRQSRRFTFINIFAYFDFCWDEAGSVKRPIFSYNFLNFDCFDLVDLDLKTEPQLWHFQCCRSVSKMNAFEMSMDSCREFRPFRLKLERRFSDFILHFLSKMENNTNYVQISLCCSVA